MTHHLTDEQLGASRDGTLSAGDAATVKRHLAECDACRGRLAELASLDAELAGALEHDPGEAYFASFADRVAARIAAAAPVAAPAAPRRGFAAWWGSPRRIAWAGGALGLLAVAALVAVLTREHGPQELALRVAPSRELGAAILRSASPADRAAKPRAGADSAAGSRQEVHAPSRELAALTPPAGAPPRTFVAAPAPEAPRIADAVQGKSAQDALRRRADAEAQPRTQAENAAPGRAQEVRTLPSGEQEVVTRGALAAPPSAPPLRLPSGLAKPAPGPLAGQPATRQSLAGGAAPAPGSLERKAAPAHPAPPEPAADAVGPGLSRFTHESGGSEMVSSVAVCGKVHDARGRPAAGALVTVAESGGTFTVGPDGAFCADIPELGGTLSVLAVGYRASRASLTAANVGTPVDITLSPVDVLTPPAKAEPGLTYNYMDEPSRKAVARPSLARRAATSASAAALKAGTAAAWTAAAERWETVELLESASGNEEAGFRVAEARVNAWLVGRDDPKRVTELRAAARKATQAFLDHATDPASIETALGWYRVLQH